MRTAMSVVLLAFTAFSATPLSAQQPPFLVMGRAGLVAQAVPFSQQFSLTTQIDERWRYRTQPAMSYGAIVETPTPWTSFGLRFEASQTGRATIKKTLDSKGPPTNGDVTTKVGVVSAAALYQPEGWCRNGICPRLIGGLGIKRYDFEGNLLWDDIVDRFADDQSRTTLQLGIGIIAYMSRFAIVAEVVDFSNSIKFASRDNPTNRVHDVSFNVGAGIRF